MIEHPTDCSSRLLSVDFDGVLHPAGQQGTDYFVWLHHLADVLAPHPDVAVVVHSTWRYVHDCSEMREFMAPLGIRFVGTTPRGPRYESIRWWLHMNPRFGNYRILDDDAREFPSPPPNELIICDPARGVADARVLSALQRWLGLRAP